jgi:hypothetical protein
MWFALIHIAAITAGAFWSAQPGGMPGAPSNGWTGPGWYIVDSSVPNEKSALRAGPIKNQGTCEAHLREAFPPAPRGHPELNVFECRELLSPPLVRPTTSRG